MKHKRKPIAITPNINRWLKKGERGISSETIISHLTGINVGSDSGPPHDPDDLRRCHLLLCAAPELRAQLPRMAEVCPVWRRLVKHWDELVALMINEAKNNMGRCPECYRRMKEIGC